MKKILSLAKWEFFEKIKKKSFLIYMFVFPIVIILLGLLPGLLSPKTVEVIKPIGILDNTGNYFKPLSEKLEKYRLQDFQPRFIVMKLNPSGSISQKIMESNKKVAQGLLNGYLLINKNSEVITYEFRSINLTSPEDKRIFEKAFNEVVTSQNLITYGISPDKINEIVTEIKMKSFQLNEQGVEEEKDFLAVFFNSYIFLMLLTMTIVFSGGTFVRSLISEKTSGIIEVMLSSISVDQLLSGKIIGLAYLSIFQFLVWSLIGVTIFGDDKLYGLELSPNFILQLVYFILGYILFISIFVGFGSITSTEQDAQQLTGLITIILVFPIVISTIVLRNPDSILAQILTYFPLTTPSIELLKLNFYTPPLWEVIITIFILLMSIYFVIKISSRIFKIGVLHFESNSSIKFIKRIFT